MHVQHCTHVQLLAPRVCTLVVSLLVRSVGYYGNPPVVEWLNRVVVHIFIKYVLALLTLVSKFNKRMSRYMHYIRICIEFSSSWHENKAVSLKLAAIQYTSKSKILRILKRGM